jgi:putative toxin-antitoxin system antitoxin component (TIGR02293 family)
MTIVTPSEIVQLQEFAREVWGSDAATERFWVEPHPLLASRTPLQVASESEAGAQLVEQILGRLKFGSAA